MSAATESKSVHPAQKYFLRIWEDFQISNRVHAPVTLGIASTSSISRDKVIPSLKALGEGVIKLVGVASRSKERAQEFAEKNGAGVGMTYDELYESGADALYIPVSSIARNPIVRKAAEKGMHVYAEKPQNGTVSEVRELLALLESKGLQWMDGTMWYHSNRTTAMEGTLATLGDIRRVTASFTWGPGIVDEAWVEGGNGRTDPKREPFGFLGDSGHYPISAVLWAFGWELPTTVRSYHTKINSVGAIVEIEALLLFSGGRRAIIDAGCLVAHRSQFEVVGDKGTLNVLDLVGGQGRSGNFGAYMGPFVGSGSYVVGDAAGKDTVVELEPCDHVEKLASKFAYLVAKIRDASAKPDGEWPKRTLMTHTTMCAVFESAMRGGCDVDLKEDGSFAVNGEAVADIPTFSY